MSDSVKITVRPNGSLRVEGPIVLCDAEGREWDLTGKPAISLCRCGHSANRPFCDGAHKQIGFECAASPAPLPRPTRRRSPRTQLNRTPRLRDRDTLLQRCARPLSTPLLLLVLGSLAVVRAQDAAPPAASLAEYQGQYRNPADPDQELAVYLDGGLLYEEAERRDRQQLVPDGAAGFRIQSPQAHIVFLRDASGAVSGLKFLFDRDGRILSQLSRISSQPIRLNHTRDYIRQQVMIPMRDGVRLHAVILRPAQTSPTDPPLPFLIDRTPYGVDDSDSAA